MKTLLIYYITLGASSKNRSPLTIWYLTFAVVNTIHKYRLKNQNNNQSLELQSKNQKIQELQNELESKNTQIESLEKLKSDDIPNLIHNSNLTDNSERIKQLLIERDRLLQESNELEIKRDELLESSSSVRKSLEENKPISDDIISNIDENTIDIYNKTNKNLDESKSIYFFILDLISGSNNNLLEIDFDILNQFDTDQIINYGGILLILWSLSSILLFYIGSYIIKRFKLEGKYPLFDRFITYREKVFSYLIKLEITSIILILFIMILYNII